MTRLEIVVYGTPAPQGSKRHVGRGVMVESSKALKPWREAVKWACLNYGNGYGFGDWDGQSGAMAVALTFTLPKPASAPKRARTWPDKRPDLDKLIRSTLDGLTEAGAIRDDAQVVELTAAKRYPGEGPDALDRPGARITIQPIGDPQ